MRKIMINVFVASQFLFGFFRRWDYFRLVCAFFFLYTIYDEDKRSLGLALEAETEPKQSKRNNVDVWMLWAISTQSRE